MKKIFLKYVCVNSIVYTINPAVFLGFLRKGTLTDIPSTFILTEEEETILLDTGEKAEVDETSNKAKRARIILK